jgi:hypothetical protein
MESLLIFAFWAFEGGIAAAGVYLSLREQPPKRHAFWVVLFLVLAAGAGVFDAVRSKVQDSNAAYQKAIENERLLAHFREVEAQLAGVGHGVQSIQSLVTKPPTREGPKALPDISLRVVYPEGFSVLLVNDSNVVLRDPKFSPVIWDLDLADRPDPMPIPTQTFTGDFIRPHESLGPFPIVTHPNAASLVKSGHRLFGYIQVACPLCKRTKGYWVWAVNGQSGWFAELAPGTWANVNALFKMLPEIRANPERFFSDIPRSKREPIRGFR